MSYASSRVEVFDKFPKRNWVIGHLGEGLPFMIQRLDQNLPVHMTKLDRQFSSYLRENIHYTFSGFNFMPTFILSPSGGRGRQNNVFSRPSVRFDERGACFPGLYSGKPGGQGEDCTQECGTVPVMSISCRFCK